MTDKELDDLFQNRFSDHKMPVPPDMWDRVNPEKEKRRRGLILWWSGLGVAALFAFVGTTTWLYHSSPEEKGIATTTRLNTQPINGSAKNTTPLNQPSGKSEKTELNGSATEQLSSGSTNEESSSSQTTQAHSKTENQIADIYTRQNNNKKNPAAPINKLQNSTGYEANGVDKNEPHNNIRKNKQDNSITNNEQATGEVRSNKNDETSEPVMVSNSNEAIRQANLPAASVQAPDSNAAATKNTAAQESKTAAAIKVTKIHGEKETRLEIMAAGYGNSRQVYNVNQLIVTGLVPFGPVSQKEKVLMNSFSLNARIDKPLTKNFSLKTGLQFLQTYQQVSYHYETVSQTLTVDAFTSDTTVFARLQSRQSIIKSTYNSLSVPLLISYHTNGAKLNFGATAGVLVNVRSWYKGNVPDVSNSQVVTAKSIFRTHTGPSLYAGITVARQVGSFQLFAEPHIQYTLSSITKSSGSFQQKITGYGFGIGIRKRIGK